MGGATQGGRAQDSRIAVLAVSQTSSHRTYWAQIQATAQALKVTPQRQEVVGPDEIEHAFANLTKGHPQGLIVLPHAVTIERRTQIVDLSAKNRLPGMYPFSLLWSPVASCPTGRTWLTCTGGPPPTWARF